MAKRKYNRYHLVADGGQVSNDYENYKEAYHDYCKELRQGHPATLYGYDEQDKVTVVWSSGGRNY